MKKDLSFKLNEISFLSIILVVFLHSYNVKVNYANGNIEIIDPLVFFVEGLISQGLTRVAVPFFFCISGFLYFINYRNNFKSYFSKIQKRFHSLVVPYFLWSLLSLCFLFVLHQMPAFSNFITSNNGDNFWSFKNVFSQIVYGGVQYQFWFLRHLLFYILISPIIYIFIIYLRFYALLLFFSLWFIYNVKYPFFHFEGFFFFSLGGFLSTSSKEENNVIENVASKLNEKLIFVSFIWFFLIIVRLVICYYHKLSFPTLEYQYILNLSILFGMLSVWFIYDRLKIYSNSISNFTSLTFFIYAFHEPTLIILKKSCFMILGTSSIAALFIYILAPSAVIFISIIIGYFLQNYFPRVLSILTGGRSDKKILLLK